MYLIWHYLLDISLWLFHRILNLYSMVISYSFLPSYPPRFLHLALKEFSNFSSQKLQHLAKFLSSQLLILNPLSILSFLPVSSLQISPFISILFMELPLETITLMNVKRERESCIFRRHPQNGHDWASMNSGAWNFICIGSQEWNECALSGSEVESWDSDWHQIWNAPVIRYD